MLLYLHQGKKVRQVPGPPQKKTTPNKRKPTTKKSNQKKTKLKTTLPQKKTKKKPTKPPFQSLFLNPNKNPIHPLYQHINEVVPMSESEFDSVLDFFTPLRREKHQYVIQEGEDVNREYWVIKGLLKSYVIDPNGKEYIVQFAMENWWITDYYAFLHHSKASMHIDCVEPSELLYISYENREKVRKEFPKMEAFWSHKTKFGYASLQNRILSLLQDPAKERYEKLIRQYPQLAQRVPKKYLAAYLGVSRETLSRLYL